VSAVGLEDGERRLAWDEYGKYRIGGQQLALLNKAGEVWFSAPLYEVENITVLLDVLRQFVKTEG
jgi:hypothetical protein